VPGIAARGLTYLGLDVHRDTISVAVLSPRRNTPEVDRIANDEPRSAGSWRSSQIPEGCGPATRPAPPATSWPGCCTAWTFAVR
jgi:hypothetical protein